MQKSAVLAAGKGRGENVVVLLEMVIDSILGEVLRLILLFTYIYVFRGLAYLKASQDRLKVLKPNLR